jgi:hypothetical protein
MAIVTRNIRDFAAFRVAAFNPWQTGAWRRNGLPPPPYRRSFSLIGGHFKIRKMFVHNINKFISLFIRNT